METGKAKRLKQLRLEKGVSLEEIQKKTKIHPNILRAIEGDAITDLSPVYLKSFLKIYCKFLEVDYREYLDDYQGVGGSQESRQEEPWIKEAPQPMPGSRSFLKEACVKIKSLRPNKRISRAGIIVLAGVFLLLGLFRLGKALFSRSENRASAPSVKAAAAKTEEAPKKPKPASQASSEISLGIRAKDNCWVSLKVDGRTVFQRVLVKGRFESWKAKKKMQLSLGNAGAVDLEVNGQLFSNLGSKGRPLKNIIITRQGLEIPR
ncbi:MAG: helix-turn-helix domain-containing protein [Candidatus Omnitrophota bacterium]